MKRNLNKKIFRGFIYVLPAVLFFSYFPVISFGANETMNFELSLPLVWLLLFAVFSFILVVKEKKFSEVFRNWKFLLLPAFLSLTILWSENWTRGILTVGIFWLICAAGFSVYIFRDYFKGEKFRDVFWKWFFSSAVFVCVWCFVQCVLDLVGVSREYSLMCAGCTYKSFGFPHPNGFAIEPQFMGNLLLAPAIMSIWMYILKKQNNKSLKLERSRGDNFYNGSVGAHKKLQFLDSLRDRCKNYAGSRFLCSKLLLFCFFVFVSTLFLTFSRGAIYAFIVAMMFMSVFVWSSKSLASGHAQGRSAKLMVPSQVFRALLKVWTIIIAAFLFTLNVQGIMAQVSPTNDTYWSGVSKVLNHMSLGIIDIRGSQPESEKSQALESEDLLVEKPVENFETTEENASFDGYVAESTEIRLTMNNVAFELWSSDLKTMLFGVGLGGTGQALYDNGLTDWPKEIVQNQYVSLLLETGLVGVILLVLTLVLIVRWAIKAPYAAAILVLMVAYGVSLMFFAGLPNALHIYLLVPVLMVFMNQSSLRKKLVS